MLILVLNTQVSGLRYSQATAALASDFPQWGESCRRGNTKQDMEVENGDTASVTARLGGGGGG